MEALVAIAVGALAGCGVYLMLRARTFPVILGLTLLSYAVNLFLMSSGRLTVGRWPILAYGQVDPADYPDPLPQALVLTAIVIGFGLTVFALVLLLRVYERLGTVRTDELVARLSDPRPVAGDRDEEARP